MESIASSARRSSPISAGSFRQRHFDLLFDGIGLTLTEKPIDRDVWVLARALMENVFVDVQDCLVYASAVIAQANALITADRRFRETVCWTYNPGAAPVELTARFTSLRTAILNNCATILGWELADVDKVVIPVQVGKADIKQFLNEGNP